jgi:L-phenylalanine/L-methionine N-acetyltransferase
MDDKTLNQAYRIRAAEPRDALSLTALLNDDAVYPNLLQTPFTPESVRQERLAKHDMANLNIVAVVSSGDSERVIANAGLYQASPLLRRAHVRGLGISIAPDWQGKGVGKALMTAMMDWADNWANVLRIELEVFPDNVRAIALYTQFGFVQEGQKRCDSFRHGEYANSLFMARLHPQQPVLRAQL